MTPVKRPPHTPLWRNPEFVISQILMVGATIIGVYLAASEGFRKAVQFQLLDADRTAYRHMAALRDEMTFNAETIASFAAQYRESGANIHDQFLPPVRTFVWESSSEHPSIFEMPPEVLGGATAIYDELSEQMARGGRGPDRRRELLTVFEEEAERIKTVMLPAFDERLRSLEGRMKSNGMTLE